MTGAGEEEADLPPRCTILADYWGVLARGRLGGDYGAVARLEMVYGGRTIDDVMAAAFRARSAAPVGEVRVPDDWLHQKGLG
uniref:Uncharacterized protein n=1 Tax=Oryza punctata TaxID=4537 RepID=A0A0E0KMZ1_ORYPU